MPDLTRHTSPVERPRGLLTLATSEMSRMPCFALKSSACTARRRTSTSGCTARTRAVTQQAGFSG